MRVTLSRILAWMRQPSTVTGLSALSAAAAGVASGEMTPAAAIPLLVFGAVAMVLPDNSAAQQDVRKLAGDTVSLVQSGGAAARVAPVVQDAAALVGDLRKPAAYPP